ncbi:NAD(P)H-dependent glycerol-3-phosphate dehydrogenase [Orrella daihaiensis]|uniref:Glycerol-3-phosphate dehydrogenase [NAD(P)+] n=1 Tax=Orrella daihaiensis TaxID=2782176 RepID=A0ABY4AK35_9BURK|nr:NAD(P)H-dependent glycerol-3-phosphate dehydrogenase [Orrella daihaiensis]UOD50642.1 NAD(P)-dependent glycerol-3-phosphate dehydrogenase [Orrella daihaiensis]
MHTPLRPHVTVLGAGAWGTAIAAAACRHAEVILWGRRPSVITAMAQTRINSEHLPGIELPSALQYSSDFHQALEHVSQHQGPGLLVLGTPMVGLPEICELIQQRLSAGLNITDIVWLCKGLTADSGKLPHELVAASMNTRELATGVLSGPSFAKEVALGLPVALTVASDSPSLRALVTSVFHSEHMRIYSSSDLMGVEVGGALKNVMAIACGISDGLGLGNNARAALITRGLAEMTRFGVALGALPGTFSGLTGLGDLVLTATGDLSRNRQVGLRVGQGESLVDILAGGMTAEGARCAQAVLARARAMNVPMPITEAVCDTLFGGVTAAHAVHRLMARSATEE